MASIIEVYVRIAMPSLPDLPSAPEGLTIDTTAVMLSWSPPQDSGGMGAVFYTVYYSSVGHCDMGQCLYHISDCDQLAPSH